MDALTLRS